MPQSLIQPAHQLIKKYTADFVSKYLDVEFAPVKNYYLKDNNGAVRKMIMILLLVAIFILLMVIINFVNINIGTSAYRLKEIGLRKVFGSDRNQLIIQFIAEAWLLTFLRQLFPLLYINCCYGFFTSIEHFAAVLSAI